MGPSSANGPLWTAEKLHLLSELMRSRHDMATESETIPRIDRSGAIPLSFGQERLWFLDQLAPGNPYYNDCEAFRLAGPLNVDALKASLNEIVARHEILRTSFPSLDGAPLQKISSHSDIPFSFDDLTSCTTDQQADRTTEIANEEVMRPFDLETGPMLRFRLVRRSDRDHVLLFTLHHIIFDGWSLGVFVQELAAFYDAVISGGTAQLPELRIQYADFAAWQRQRVTGTLHLKQLEYWRERLAQPRARLELPTDFPRPSEPEYHGKLCPVGIGSELSAALGQLARRENVTLFVVLLAAYKLLLYAISAEKDILVGTAVANRYHRDVEPLMGFILNTLALRTHLSADLTFRDLLSRVAETNAGACDHQDLPFEKLVAELNPDRRLNHNPLFQVWFTLFNAPKPQRASHGLEIHFSDVETRTSRFDLALILWKQGEDVDGHFEYSSELYHDATVKAFAVRYRSLLQRAVNRPEAHLGELIGIIERQARDQERAARRKRKDLQAERLAKLRRRSRRTVKTQGRE